MMVGEVDHNRNGFNPSDILTDFDYGKVSTLENGQTLREYDIYVINKDIEIAPGHRLSSLDLQWAHSRSNHPLHRRRSPPHYSAKRFQPPPLHALSWHPRG